MHDQPSQDWSKPSAPLAHLLNNDITALYNSHQQHAGYLPQNASAAAFSGKLVDLLLDPADVPNSHRRTESNQQQHGDANMPSAVGPAENHLIQLPKPPQLPKQTTKRPRIPPLLQGLHQPPPLPPAERLFPPITENVRAETDVAGQEKQKDDAEPTTTVPAKQVNTTLCVDVEQTESAKKTKVRKRRKWSDEETKDLLVGVSRFGIGSWKKILQCEEFQFHGRTAVDLKDRFRVCCPGEGLKARKDARKDRSKAIEVLVEKENVDLTSQNAVPSGAKPATIPETTVTKKLSKSHQIDSTERAKLGIEAPFVRNPRRSRQAFTPENDRNLWRGYEKHGPIWHIIRDDEDLGFTDRHPTDLRDRFRIRYPQAFAKAGFKPKANSNVVVDNEAADPQSTSAAHNRPAIPRTTSAIDLPSNTRQPQNIANGTPTRSSEHDMPHLASKHSAHLPFSLGPTSSWLDDMPHTSFNPEGSESPIILNRNILQWADSNNLSTPHPRSHTQAHLSDIMNDITPINDGVHIDPMATLKLPFMALPSFTLTPVSSQTAPLSNMPHLSGSSSLGQRGLLTSPPRTHHTSSTYNLSTLNTDTIFSTTPQATPTKSSSASMAGHINASNNNMHMIVNGHGNANTNASAHLLRTPNLPTIVFPHVPVASARNAVHNLPTPADLLSGMGSGDVDMGMGEFGVVFGNGYGQGSGSGHG